MATARVLVVDDNLELNATLCEFLRDEGFEAVPAIDGHEAIVRAISDEPDVIVLDLKLPDIDGVKVLGQLHRRGVDSPVILESCLPAPFRHGADAFLPKPFDLDRLLSLIRRFVNRPPTPANAAR
jgi:DNA-binding response OmpR family regulator